MSDLDTDLFALFARPMFDFGIKHVNEEHHYQNSKSVQLSVLVEADLPMFPIKYFWCSFSRKYESKDRTWSLTIASIYKWHEF